MLRHTQTGRPWQTRSVVVCVGSALLSLTAASAIEAQTHPGSMESFGGKHEFGLWSGYSPHAGAVVGYVENFTYSPTVLRYSYLLRQRNWWAVRYAPEVTAFALLHEKAPSQTNPAAPISHFGAGFSPEALQAVFLPQRRIQPFISTAGGMLYFNGRVLSPGGSQFMYTVDLGAGVNFFTSPRNAIVVGFRYQHLSNANISHHNPGADAQTIYIGFSRFHTHRSR